MLQRRVPTRMAAPSSNDAMKAQANAEFIRNVRRIYDGRNDADAPPPMAFTRLPYTNYFDSQPDHLQGLVDRFVPPIPEEDTINLTPLPDISRVDESLVQVDQRLGANGSSLRSLAMRYVPNDLRFVMSVVPGIEEIMYNFYGKSSLEIHTTGPVGIRVSRFHQNITSLLIRSDRDQDILLQEIIDKMQPNTSLSWYFEVNFPNQASIRANSVDDLRSTMRGFLDRGLDVMQEHNGSTSMTVSFKLPFTAGERNDDSYHQYLDSRARLSPAVHVDRPLDTRTVVTGPNNSTLHFNLKLDEARLSVFTVTPYDLGVVDVASDEEWSNPYDDDW